MMLEDPSISEFLRLPVVEQSPRDRLDPTVRNIYDSLGWWDHVRCGAGRDRNPTTFGTENNRRNIVISINIDGFKPHKNSQRSITPIVGMVLNLPENLRHKSGYLLLIGVIPGPNAPSNMDPYLQILVDELLYLWNEGMEIADPTIGGRKVKVRVKLLFTCADYPAHGKVNMQQVQSAKWGCIKCHIQVRFYPTFLTAHAPDRGQIWALLCIP
jgi:hypothetical protein